MRTVFCLVLGITLAESALANTNSTELCNQGTTSLYFATVGENDSLLQSGAMVQGLVEVAPDRCANLVPYGMNKVILTFFKKDRRGYLTNVRIVPKNATSVRDDIRHVCVNMQQPYRLFRSRQEIFSGYVNADCPDGFSPANPSIVHRPGGFTEFQVEIHADTAAVPWRDKSGRSYKNPPVLSLRASQSAGELIEGNPATIRDQIIAKEILEGALEYKKRADQEAEERQRQAWIRRQQQLEHQQAELDRAERSLQMPPDDVCAEYLQKTRYTKDKDIAVSGVKLGMDLKSAHEALVCNGFTIEARMLAQSGGVERFWASPYAKVFRKSLADGTVVFTDVETRPPRGAPAGSEYVVVSVRVRYLFPQRLPPSEWQRVRKEFKAMYPAGKRKVENDVAIHKLFTVDRVRHSLQLNAPDYRNGSISQYNITIM